MIGEDRLLTPAEVAARFKVHPRTVNRWAIKGKLSGIRTPGKHRRFWESEVRALLEESPPSTPSQGRAAPEPGPTAQEGNTC